MKRTLRIVCTVACALSAFAQTQIDLRTQGKDVDFSGATSTKPMKSGAALPASCNTGELFFLTTAQAGANVYGCTAAGTWTRESSGAGGGSGAVTVQNNGTPIGSPRATINFISGQGIANAITDTGSVINVSEGTDSTVIPTKSSLQSGAATTITVTSSSPTTYTGTLTPALTTYTGAILTWTPGTSCTPGAVTININGLGAVPVVEANGTTTPVAGDCAATNIDTIAYDGAKFRIIAGGSGATGPAGTNGAISTIQNNGTTQTVRPNLNLISGANATVVCADNSGASRTDCTVSATGAGGGGSITVQSNGTPVGSPRTTINFISSQGIATAITDTGSVINVSEGTDSAVIPTKSSLQSAAATTVSVTSSSPTAYIGSLVPTLTTYTGAILTWTPGTSCTPGPITININSLGAVPVVEANGTTNPVAADCAATNIDTIAYDGAKFRIIAGGAGTAGSSGGGAGAPNVTATGSGSVTSLAINIASLNLTSIASAVIQCWTASGAAVAITGYTTTGTSPITTVTPTFASTANPTCVVNSNGGAGPAPGGTGLVVVNSGVTSAVTVSGNGTLNPATGVLTVTGGAATTATALASTPTLCPAGQAPTGILASGNATGCAAIGGGGGGTGSYGKTVLAADQTFTSTAVLANLPGITYSLAAATQYNFQCSAAGNALSGGGVVFSPNYTGTVTSGLYIDRYENIAGLNVSGAGYALVGGGAWTTLTGHSDAVDNRGGSNVSAYTARGSFTTGTAGTFTLQAAQFTASATGSTVKANATYCILTTTP